jgi:cytoskeletal protein RodZ
MDPIQKRELKRQAWMRLTAQRRRAGVLRGRVVAISLICFVVLWGVVFAQMATGNDPVLSGKEKAVASRTATSSRQAIETTDRRELEPERHTDSKAAAREEEAEEVEAEAEEVETEPAVEEVEVEAQEAEPEVEEVEVEEAELEPLVTSQS